jgi:hypothetical protein
MSRSGLRRAVVVVVALIATLLVATVPAQASTSKMTPLSAGEASQARALTTSGSDTVLSVAMDVTCYLAVGDPYGGGAPDADVAVDAAVYCDDYVDVATLQIQLYRDGSLVTSDIATYPYTFGVYGTVGITDCVPGTYFGAATAVLARYDLTPPVISATKRSFDVQISCGGPGTGIPTPPNCQVNPQLCARMTD